VTIAVVQKLAEEEWCRFVEEHPQGNIFHTPEMFQVFARAEGHQPKLWAATDDDGQVLALLLPVHITLINGLPRRFTTRAVAYGSILYAPGAEGQEALAVLLRAYRQEMKSSLLFTELRNTSDMSDARPMLRKNGFVYEDHLNYLIDLNKPIEEVWQGIDKSCRKAIRRSMNKEVITEELQDRDLVPICYDLLQQSYKRAKVPLAALSLFESIFDILVPKGMAKLLLARVDDRYIATSVEMPYKDTIYSWYAGYDRSYRSFYPNDILVWHILKWGVENGYRCYDFGGAGRPDEPYGVRDFKAKFGGQLTNFGRYTCVHAPALLALSRVGYQIYRKVYRVRHLRG
jgi:lipid II:glycine glycyltransferase (peptidoglycan interpeptide bridge formation enzyme)